MKKKSNGPAYLAIFFIDLLGVPYSSVYCGLPDDNGCSAVPDQGHQEEPPKHEQYVLAVFQQTFELFGAGLAVF